MSQQKLLQKRYHRDFDLNLKVPMSKLQTLRYDLELSDELNEKAILLYKKINEQNMIKSRPIGMMVAATIYVVCRDSDIPYTLKDIAKVTGLRKKSIAKYYRYILTNLNIQIPASNTYQYVLRISRDMKISEKMKQYAIAILNNAKEKNHLEGKKPMAMAAAAIYLASTKIDEKISQQKLAKAAKISDVTIRKRCNGLRTIK